MSDLRRGCIGMILAAIILVIFDRPGSPDIHLRCLQGITFMMFGFAFAVALFGRSEA